MRRNPFIVFIMLSLCFSLVGCAAFSGDNNLDIFNGNSGGIENIELGTTAPRLVISGTVSNNEGTPLSGIRIDIYGVREETEGDIITYNYAITDTAGLYTIIRYRGREYPREVTVVASDPNKVYSEQTIFAPIHYDHLNGKEHNGYATADFLLGKE